jgi:esterase/lipase
LALLQKKIKSITVTGHSLGGALASLCAYDLSEALQEATAGSEANQTEEVKPVAQVRILPFCIKTRP